MLYLSIFFSRMEDEAVEEESLLKKPVGTRDLERDRERRGRGASAGTVTHKRRSMAVMRQRTPSLHAVSSPGGRGRRAWAVLIEVKA